MEFPQTSVEPGVSQEHEGDEKHQQVPAVQIYMQDIVITSCENGKGME